MPDFDPSIPSTSFAPPPRRRERRRVNEIRFLEQAGRRFVAKSFAEPGDPPEEAQARIRRELEGVEAFRAAGATPLAPVLGPLERLDLALDGGVVSLEHAMVFPFVEGSTLYDEIAGADAPEPLVARAAATIRERHDRAERREAVHSDGSSHNVFSDWTWFDFGDAHVSDDLRTCKAFEVLRFVASVVEVSPAGTAGARVEAFCGAYGDRGVLLLARDLSAPGDVSPRGPAWLRMVGRPDKLVRFWRGETQHFRRARTRDALDRALRD